MVEGEERGGWRRFWELSRTERYGVLVLLFLLSGHLLFRFLEYRNPPSPPVEWVAFAPVDSAGHSIHTPIDSRNPVVEAGHLFPFDFQTADSLDFLRLGLPQRKIASLLRYRARGGQIRSLRDWYALRVLSDADKERLAPYLRIESDSGVAQNGRVLGSTNSNKGVRVDVESHSLNPNRAVRPWGVQELNRSDSTGWDAIPGVGPATARRIIEYRDRLGGFMNVGQLREVFGIDSLRYESILPFVKLEVPVNIRRISLNRCSESELAAHPYAGRTLARRLIAFRDRHGQLPAPDSLVRLRLYGVDSARLSQLLPYLQP